MTDIDTADFGLRPEFFIAVLNGAHKTPITGYEMEVAQSRSLLIKIDEAIPEGYAFKHLHEIPAKTARLASLRDLVMLFVDCYHMDELETAVEIVHFMIEDRQFMGTKELVDAVERSTSGGLPASLSVALDGDAERETTTYKMPSGLNLEAMRDFK